MEFILEGAINREHSAEDMLRGIISAGYFQRTTLTISSTDQATSGTVLITKGRGIKGARMDTHGYSGYRALRELLSLKQAYFTYETGGDESIGEESGALNMDIMALVKYLPALPSQMPAEFHSNETIPPNSNFKDDVQRMAALQARAPKNSSLVSKAEDASCPEKVKELATGLERMRDFEYRSMILRAPIFWTCFLIVAALIWILWGNDITAMINSKHFAWFGSP